MFRKFKDSFSKTGEAVREFPMVLLMALLGAVALMCFAELNFNSQPANFFFVKFAMVSILGISLMFGLKMLSQRIGRTTELEIAGVIFLAGFYLILPQNEEDFTEKYAFLIIPTFVLSHLFVSFSAFLNKENELTFWQFNKNLLISFFLTAVFTGVFTGGVELAVLAVDQLFDFNFSDRIYLQIFYLLSIFGSAFIFTLFNQGGLQKLEKDGNYPVVLKFFTQYILIPLLLIYAVILYFYGAKIIIRWELPRGWVSYLILAYSIVGIFALLLVHPLKEKVAKSWVKLFSKIFYFSLNPLLVLLFIAIFTRILAYGYTEPRYFVLLLALWLATVVLYFIFAPKPTIKYIPASLFAFGIFSLVFPYLNTFSVAKRSQRAELSKILNENNLLKNQTIDFNIKVPDSIADEVSDKFRYLSQRGDSAYLTQFLSKKDRQIIFKNTRNYPFRGEMRTRSSNVVNTKNTELPNTLEIFSEKQLRTISGFDYMLRFEDFNRKTSVKVGHDNFYIENITDFQKPSLNIRLNDDETWDLMPFIKKTVETAGQKSGRIEVPELATEKQMGNYRVKIYFNSIISENVREQRIYFNGGFILIGKKGGN